MSSWLVARERWLPGAAGFVWWITFYPGFFGDDSLINLGEARSGAYSVWFTAWWIYVVDALSLGTRAIPLLTLAGVLTLEYSAYLWVAAVFSKGKARGLTVLLLALTPLVGAMGIQVRHDAFMTAGLLLCATVLTRTWPPGNRFTRIDVAMLALAMPLVATRHNGLPTVAVSAVILMAWSPRAPWWRQAVALFAVAAGAAVITYGATRASGNTNSVHPHQTVEWLIADISCALSKGAQPTADEWAVLGRIAPPADWPQERACRAMNPIVSAPAFNQVALEENYRPLIDVWFTLTRRYPGTMAAAHASRVRLFLPPLVTGMPVVENFLHSTIMSNDFGLEWAFPGLATRARNVVRAWNALGFILANAAVWLIVLVAVAWRRVEYRSTLTPTIAIAAVLLLGLVVAAPISEGRYGLFILICGQATAAFLIIRIATHSSDRPSTRATLE